MKKIFPQLVIIGAMLSILLSSCNSPFGKSSDLTEKQVLKVSCYTKVWGFLKYYHPGLANGQLDWDSVYTEMLPKILNSDAKGFELCIENLIDLPGVIHECDSCKSISDYPKEWSRNLTLDWIYDHPLLTDKHTEYLISIFENRLQGKGHYVEYLWEHSGPVKFINENAYSDSIVVADYRYRILALARYWNSVEYFFAYKYLLSKDWNNVLMEYIPLLKEEASILDYHLTIFQLTKEIEDSHSGGSFSNYLFTNHWDKKVPFDVTTIDDRTIVSDIPYKTLNSINDIEIGDEILMIDSVTAEEARRIQRKYCLGSNERTTSSATDNMLLWGHSDKLHLTILRNGVTQNTIVDRFPYKTFWSIEKETDTMATFHEKFAVVYLARLESKEHIDSIMDLAKTKPSIIFDLRDYPMFDIYDLEAHFVEESRPVFKAFEPSLDDIGVFKPSALPSKKLEIQEHYNGKIIVLVNEYTQSYAESIAMFFQTLPQTIIVGSQTAGANGNTVKIQLPGNIRASFSNIIIEYPDGSQSQKTGIKIDYQVVVTLEDVVNKKDSYIEMAKRVIEETIL